MSGSASLGWLIAGGYYDTQFPLTENPMREGSVWLEGAADGVAWTNLRTSSNLCWGTQSGSGGFDDSHAILKSGLGFTADHKVTLVIHKGTVTNPVAEVWCGLRRSLSANSSSGYEINLSFDGLYLQLIRWDGPFGKFTQLDQGSTYTVNNGSILVAQIKGNIITASLDGTPITWTNESSTNHDITTDSPPTNGSGGPAYYTSGTPGSGNFTQNGGASDQTYCVSRFTAANV